MNGSQFKFTNNFSRRQRTSAVWQSVFRASTVAGILALILLVFNIIDGAFGYAALEYRVDPRTLAVEGIALEDQSQAQLVATLQANISKGAYNKLENEQPFSERSAENVYQLIVERVVRYKVDEAWSLWESLTQADEIKARVASDYPEAELRFINWLNADFVSRPQTSEALTAGIRTAILGSLWTIFITILFAFPVGVGAAIYLEEYANDTWINRLIRTNINNLAGVPSIVYGILGLAIFVRALEPLTSEIGRAHV